MTPHPSGETAERNFHHIAPSPVRDYPPMKIEAVKVDYDDKFCAVCGV